MLNDREEAINVFEDQEQSIARFMSGLHRNIQRIVEFQPYHNLIELVHQASKAERQLQQDMKSNRGGSFSAKVTPSGRKFTPRSNANRVQSPTQVVVHALLRMLLPVGKTWLLKVRRANLQHHHLHQ